MSNVMRDYLKTAAAGLAKLSDEAAFGPGEGVRKLSLSALVPRPQPRRRFEEASLQALADSIRAHGVLEPLLVRSVGEGKYEIVAGERRYRAAQMVGLTEVPVRVLDLSEREAHLLALVENLQREDLNPYEETLGVLELLSEDLGEDEGRGGGLASPDAGRG